jgi:glycosyltransferase involved in cell wall biosynthesis
MKAGERISVIIPARDERDSLPAVLLELPRHLVYETIVVDGHSTDGTPEVVRRLGHRVVVQRGRGYGSAVLSGIEHATGDLLTFIDADGSYDPAALPAMLERIRQGDDVVFCSRYLPGAGSEDDTPIRYLGNLVFTWLVRRLFGVRITDSLFFYALGKRAVFETVALESRGFALCAEVLIKIHRAGYRYSEIPSRERPRIAGKSKVNALVDGARILLSLVRLRLSR